MKVFWRSLVEIAWAGTRPLRCAVGMHPSGSMHPLCCPASPQVGSGRTQRWWCSACRRSWGTDGRMERVKP